MTNFRWLVNELNDEDMKVLTSGMSAIDIVSYMNDKFGADTLDEIKLLNHSNSDDYYLIKDNTVEVYTHREVFNVKED